MTKFIYVVRIHKEIPECADPEGLEHSLRDTLGMNCWVNGFNFDTGVVNISFYSFHDLLRYVRAIQKWTRYAYEISPIKISG